MSIIKKFQIGHNIEIEDICDQIGKSINEVYEYKVKDIEFVNGKECFKVEITVLNIEENRITIRKILWVDMSTRTLVKGETMLNDNLKVIDVNLKEVRT